MSKKLLHYLVLMAIASVSSGIFAHANIMAKDAYNTADGRSYLEGGSAEINLNLAHGCGTVPTVIATMAFPNAADSIVYHIPRNPETGALDTRNMQPIPGVRVTDFLETLDSSGVPFGGNPLMGIRPEADDFWQGGIASKTGPVPEYYNHGAQTTDVIAIHWHDGYVPADSYRNNKFRANFPKFKPDSCATLVRVFLPSVQYCGQDVASITEANYWLFNEIPEAGVITGINEHGINGSVSTGFAPHIDIHRDLSFITSNPKKLSAKILRQRRNFIRACGEQGEAYGVYPSTEVMKQFLVHDFGDHSSGGGGGLICADGQPANPPDHVIHHGPWCSDGSTPQ